MSVRTGMYHFEVSRTAMYRVRYVLVHTSTYRHVLPCTRCTGFQMHEIVIDDSYQVRKRRAEPAVPRGASALTEITFHRIRIGVKFCLCN